jgi:hypothetical protein
MFVHRHGWYIRGLEPSDTAAVPATAAEWIPEYLQSLLEKRFGENGVDLRGLAALAAALEDLITKEAEDRLGAVYQALELPIDNERPLDKDQAGQVVDIFLMGYLRGVNFSNIATVGAVNITARLSTFASKYDAWDMVSLWSRQQMKRAKAADENGGMNYSQMLRFVDIIGQEFAGFNEPECISTKTWLLKSEDKKPGRVKLKDFYARGLLGHWEFTEKIDFLRVMGALDETEPDLPRVIVPNYVASRSNCLEVSSLYTMCCFNECEDLMQHLESEIAAPWAAPKRIAELVGELSSETVRAPRELPADLMNRLEQIAGTHGGHVPLHGRLFAQWMHHAFPRECPFPHEKGATGVQTPDEWMEDAGEEGHIATQDEMLAQLGDMKWHAPADHSVELPWAAAERLVAAHHHNGTSDEILAVPTALSVEDVETTLLTDLAGGVEPRRLVALQDALRPTFTALPRGPDGYLGHQVIRYVLHRMFVQRHGWYIRGLEPSGTSSAKLEKEWIPSYLQGLVEKHFGGAGVDLRGLASVAATLEDLISTEAAGRLNVTYSALGLSIGTTLSEGDAELAASTFLMGYLQGNNFSTIGNSSSSRLLLKKVELFGRKYAGWKDVHDWSQGLRKKHSAYTGPTTGMPWTTDISVQPGGLDFEGAKRMANAIGEEFGMFNDK